MNYCFDTSALNALHDDADRDAIATGLVATSTVFISGLNIADVCAIGDAEKRLSLRSFLSRLSSNRAPLQVPNLLLQELTLAYSRKEGYVRLSVGENEAPQYKAMLNCSPEMGEELRRGMRAWQKSFEQPFKDIFRRARAAFQKLFSNGRVKRPRSRSALIRHYCKDHEFLLRYVGPIYRRLVGAELSLAALPELLSAVPSWVLYLGGWALSIFERDIRLEGYGAGRKGKAGKKPGTLDLWCAVYLPYCDRFVTKDPKQRRALRLLNVYDPRKPRTEVISYEELRRRLLLSPARSGS